MKQQIKQTNTIDEKLFSKLKQFSIIDEEVQNSNRNTLENNQPNYELVNIKNTDSAIKRDFKVINNKKINSVRASSPLLSNQMLITNTPNYTDISGPSKGLKSNYTSGSYSKLPYQSNKSGNSSNNNYTSGKIKNKYDNYSTNKGRSKSKSKDLNSKPNSISLYQEGIKTNYTNSKLQNKRNFNENCEFDNLYHYNNIREKSLSQLAPSMMMDSSNYNSYVTNKIQKSNNPSFSSKNALIQANLGDINSGIAMKNQYEEPKQNIGQETINLNLNLNINKNQFKSQDIILKNDIRNEKNDLSYEIEQGYIENKSFQNNYYNSNNMQNQNNKKSNKNNTKVGNFNKFNDNNKQNYPNQISADDYDYVYNSNDEVELNDNKLEGNFGNSKYPNENQFFKEENKSQEIDTASHQVEKIEDFPNYSALKKKLYQITNVKSQDGLKSSNPVSLYEDFKRIKSKLEKKKDTAEEMRKRSMSPNITSMARNIQRDPNNFQERLYPYHKVNQGYGYGTNALSSSGYPDNIKLHFHQKNHLYKVLDENDVFDIYGHKINHDNIYHKEKPKIVNNDFTFSPVFNKKSIQIASKLEPAFERLISKRSKSKTSCNSRNQSFCKANDKKDENTPQSKKPNTGINSRRNSPPGCRLYQQGINKLKQKFLDWEIKCTQAMELHKQFDYTPNILPSSRRFIENTVKRRDYSDNNNVNKSFNSNKEASENKQKDFNQQDSNIHNKSGISKHDSFYERNLNWKNYISEKLSKDKEKQTKQENINCTFTPEISNNRIPTDEKMIKRNLSGMYEYVMRRRGSLSKDKEQKDLYDKKFNNGKYYQIKPTKTVNVTFEMDRRLEKRQSKVKVQPKADVHSFRELTNSNSFYINPESISSNQIALNNVSKQSSDYLNNKKQEIDTQNKKFVNAVSTLKTTLNQMKL